MRANASNGRYTSQRSHFVFYQCRITFFSTTEIDPEQTVALEKAVVRRHRCAPVSHIAAVAVPTSSRSLGWHESIIIWMYIRRCRAAWLFPLLLIASCETASPASTIT